MRFVRSLALRAASEVATKAGGVVLMLAAARSLGTEQFGIFALAWSTGWIVALGCDMGLHMAATRDAARGEREVGLVAGTLLGAKAMLGLVASLALGIAASLLVGGQQIYVVCAVGFGLVGWSIVDFVQHLLRGRGAFEKDALLQVAARVALVVFGLVGLAVGGLRGLATGVLVAGAAGALAAAASLAADCGRPSFGPQPVADVLRAIAGALPVGVGMLVSVLAFRLDVYLVGAFLGEAAVGLYASGYRVFEASQMLPSVVMTAAFPRLASADLRGGIGPLRRRVAGGLAAVGLGVAAIGSAASDSLVQLLFGAAYAAAAVPLSILFWAVPFMFVNYFLTQDLIARGRRGAFAVASTVALAANLCLNLVAIPRYGLPGAAVVTVASEAALLVACCVALVRPRVLR